ncbi:peptidase dimerization domain-containing protein, partial [Klebsiella pneumoniae]|nr:peptidase dimerization domain-containing protein [Klebsiella pneumoniae]
RRGAQPGQPASPRQGATANRSAAGLINPLARLGGRLARPQDSRFSPPFSTLQVGTIQGGAGLNIVPQSCRFDFEIRYLPGMRPEAVTEALAAYA